MEMRNYLYMEYHEFDKLARSISEVPDDYEIVAYEELVNDTWFVSSVDVSEPFYDYEINYIKDKKWEYNAHLILKILAKGKKLPIEKGRILIQISW